MNDADIIELYWQRDEKATDAAYTKYSRYCHAIALNIVGEQDMRVFEAGVSYFH